MEMPKIDKSTRVQYRRKVEEGFPDRIDLGDIRFKKSLSMRYGENPGYPAAFYQEREATGPNMATLEILQEGTKGLSYINVGIWIWAKGLSGNWLKYTRETGSA